MYSAAFLAASRPRAEHPSEPTVLFCAGKYSRGRKNRVRTQDARRAERDRSRVFFKGRCWPRSPGGNCPDKF